MFKKFLVAAVVIVFLRKGSAQVTLSPKLAKIIPKDLPPLREEYVICFNNFWAEKERLETEIRQRWNCTDGCSRGQECCISYQMWDSLSGLKLGEDCTRGAQNMIRVFLPMALKKIEERCAPEYEHGSLICKTLVDSLPPVPKGGSCGANSTKTNSTLFFA